MRFPLNGFDRALLAQTYPGRPMTTHHVLDLAAPLDRAALAGAVRALGAEVPALRSVVRETALGFARVPAPPSVPLEWHDTPADLDAGDALLRPFDLAREAPFRVTHAARRGGGHRLVFTLHHGVTDGAGALLLWDALLRHYDARAGRAVAPAAPIAARGGRLRDLVARGGARLVAALVRANVAGAGRFGLRRASLLEDRAAPTRRLRCLVLDVAPDRWRALGQRARAEGCSRNDLVLAAVLRAASAARRARGAPDETFRVLEPADLRGAMGVGRALQNHLGVVECDVAPAEVDAPDLPRVLAARLREARAPERLLATPFALGALAAALPPPALRALFRWLDGRAGAFMYSFLYSAIRARDGVHLPAGVAVERAYCASTLPEQPGVGFTLTEVGDRVTIAMVYPEPRLSPEGAAALGARLLGALDAAG